jgi:hypothetical protein
MPSSVTKLGLFIGKIIKITTAKGDNTQIIHTNCGLSTSNCEQSQLLSTKIINCA